MKRQNDFSSLRRLALATVASSALLACGGNVTIGEDHATTGSDGAGGTQGLPTSTQQAATTTVGSGGYPMEGAATTTGGSYGGGGGAPGSGGARLDASRPPQDATHPPQDATHPPQDATQPTFDAAGTEFPATYPPAACAVPGQAPAPQPTKDALIELLVGQWLTCTGSVFGTTDEVGLEIAADGTWYKLYPGSPGMVRRGQGFDQIGTWTVLDAGPPFQVNFDIFGSGSIFTHPAFTTVPRKMRLNNNGVFQGDYAIDAP